MAAQMMKEMMMTSVGDVYRQFIPSQQGESLDEQIYPWSFEGISQRLKQPIPIHELDPITVVNILQMKAVEMQHWVDYQMLAQTVSNQKFKGMLNSIAWAEHLHYLTLASLLPASESSYQEVLMGELAVLACYDKITETEPNADIRAAFDHIGMDHLTHAEYAANQLQSSGFDIKRITGGMDLSGGRPLSQQFMKPADTMWKGSFSGVYDKSSVDKHTLVNVDMALAGELAAWNVYGCASSFEKDASARSHYSAYSSIENQHVSILGSIKDPSESVLERALVHEQVEMQGYSQLMNSEPNSTVRQVFADLQKEDMEQARIFGQMA